MPTVTLESGEVTRLLETRSRFNTIRVMPEGGDVRWATRRGDARFGLKIVDGSTTTLGGMQKGEDLWIRSEDDGVEVTFVDMPGFLDFTFQNVQTSVLPPQTVLREERGATARNPDLLQTVEDTQTGIGTGSGQVSVSRSNGSGDTETVYSAYASFINGNTTSGDVNNVTVEMELRDEGPDRTTKHRIVGHPPIKHVFDPALPLPSGWQFRVILTNDSSDGIDAAVGVNFRGGSPESSPTMVETDS